VRCVAWRCVVIEIRNIVCVSVSLATQRNAMHSRNGNEPSRVTRHRHTGSTHARSNAWRPAPAWGVVGERGKERRQTRDVHPRTLYSYDPL